MEPSKCFFAELFPSSRRGQQLESDGEGVDSEGFAIDHSCPSPKISRQGPKIQPLIELPGIARNHTNAVGAHVFGEALLRRMANIETAEIHSNGQGNALLHSADDGLHGTPHGLTQNGLVGAGGGSDKDIVRSLGADFGKESGARAGHRVT